MFQRNSETSSSSQIKKAESHINLVTLTKLKKKSLRWKWMSSIYFNVHFSKCFHFYIYKRHFNGTLKNSPNVAATNCRASGGNDFRGQNINWDLRKRKKYAMHFYFPIRWCQKSCLPLLKKGSLKVGYKDRSEKLQKNQDDIFYERIKNINDLCLMHFCITLSQNSHFCPNNWSNFA